MFGNLRRYLQAQRQVIFIPVAVLFGLIVQIIALIILVNVLDWGYVGACIALPCSYWSMTGSLYFFTKCNRPLRKAVNATWPGWGTWALKDWPIFLRLSIPGTCTFVIYMKICINNCTQYTMQEHFNYVLNGGRWK